MSIADAIRARPLTFLFGFAAVSLLGLYLFVPPIPQPQTYHRFADQRTLLGIPNFWNVVSNLPFILVGAMGLTRVRGNLSASTTPCFAALKTWMPGTRPGMTAERLEQEAKKHHRSGP